MIVFCLWRGTEAEFPGFLATMNSVDQNIRFTYEMNWIENEVVFLDQTITIALMTMATYCGAGRLQLNSISGAAAGSLETG